MRIKCSHIKKLKVLEESAEKLGKELSVIRFISYFKLAQEYCKHQDARNALERSLRYCIPCKNTPCRFSKKAHKIFWRVFWKDQE